MKVFWDIFIAFCKIGATTFGGGYAMMPVLQREVVEKRGWATEAEVMDYYAIAQCLPGIIAGTTAMFIGHKIKGACGGLAAVMGIAFPSLLIIMVIAAFLANFADIPMVQNAFAGVRVCVVVLIIEAIIKLRKSALLDVATVSICAVVFALSLFIKVTPILFVMLAGVAGVLLSIRKKPGT